MNRITLLDGGLGQELLKGPGKEPTGLWSAAVLIDDPDIVYQVHRDYFAAGADIATTNSYVLHRDRLRRFGIEDRFADLHRLACELAVRARDVHGRGRVAGSLGPTGASYRPELAPPAEEAAELFAEIARLQAPYVDLLLCETMASVDQARGALMGAKSVGMPVWLAVTVDDEDGTRLRSGENLVEILPVVEEFDPDALLVNCSVPEAVDQAIPLLVGLSVPVGAYANGFRKISADFLKEGATVDALEKRTHLDPDTYADFVDGWIARGATIVGGCCEIGPEYIRELDRRRRGE
jgi:S-methylmethionine-dependent homocysteine/selenocysteine methylase